jgi:hypothetical protein
MVQFWLILVGFLWDLVSSGAVLVRSGELWCSFGVVWGFMWLLVNPGGFWWVLGAVLVCSGVVPVGSGEFWWVLVSSGTVLVCSGGVLVGSGDFWWILVGCVEFWSSSGLF